KPPAREYVMARGHERDVFRPKSHLEAHHTGAAAGCQVIPEQVERLGLLDCGPMQEMPDLQVLDTSFRAAHEIAVSASGKHGIVSADCDVAMPRDQHHCLASSNLVDQCRTKLAPTTGGIALLHSVHLYKGIGLPKLPFTGDLKRVECLPLGKANVPQRHRTEPVEQPVFPRLALRWVGKRD